MRDTRPITRWRAGAYHLALSALVAVTAFVGIYAIWYPGELFGLAGGRTLFLILAGVDVVLGPVLTTIVYRHGKKGLAFDLAVIAIVQVAALAYGVWVLFEARPVYITFVRDRFELVRANEIDPAELAKAPGAYAALPLDGPRYASVRMPKDPDEQLRVMMSGASGVDIQRLPQYYVSYDDGRADVRAKAKPLAALQALNPKSPDAVARIVERSGKPEARLGFLPMRAGRQDYTVIVDTQAGDVVDIVDLRPWEY